MFYLYDIYNRNIINGNENYTRLYYNEQDILQQHLINFKNVDYFVSENWDLNKKLTKIDGRYLKSNHRVILINQNNKIENGIYTFDNDGKLIKTDDLDNTDKSFRYFVHVKLDNNQNIELFLNNSGQTFPTTDEEKDFEFGHAYIIKNYFNYITDNLLDSLDSSDKPKLWFTDYNFARKLNSKNHELYNEKSLSSPSSIKIKYRNYPETNFFSGTTSYNGSFGWEQSLTGTTLNGITISCNPGDYLDIKLTGDTYAEFKTQSYNYSSTNLQLIDYIPDYILSGMTTINISNLNRYSSSSNLNNLNEHFLGDFMLFSGTTIYPIENPYFKYIDYDGFEISINTSSYVTLFESNNQYINYKLYEHLNDIKPSIFTSSFNLGSGFTLTNFDESSTYLNNDDSYPQSISDQDSPLKITPDNPSELDYFYKYTSVFIDGDTKNKVFILDKDSESFTIERPINSGITSISTDYSLTGISETLYDLYINYGTGNTTTDIYYKKDNEFISRVCKTYNELLSNDEKIREYTTGTITPDFENKPVLKLFNYRNNYNTSIPGNTIGDFYYLNDPLLTLKPIEILDIGVDKQTKFPIRIKTEDIKIYDDSVSGYIVDIITDSIDNNITLVNGLTVENLKIKYQWIFNAIIENAIIGEDSYGLVWYSGNWICGEWYDGTWLSGTWYDGIWKNGRWYSWLIDKYEILTNQILVKLDDNKIYSKFLNGVWKNGYWFNGIFGDEIDIHGYTSKKFLNHSVTITEYLTDNNIKVATWENGNYYNGDFKNSIWENGNFLNGKMWGGYWKNGTFFNGTFSGNWWNGSFLGGDFVFGIWENGLFTSTKNRARFGYNYLETTGTTTEWWNGKMTISEIFPSNIYPYHHNRTHWYNGTFEQSKWYGGHFFNGTFKNSIFYNGVFGAYSGYTGLDGFDELVLNETSGYTSTIIFDNNEFLNGLWLDGTFKNGKFKNGIWLNGKFENGEIMTDKPKKPIILKKLPSVTQNNLNIKRSIL